MYKEKLLAYIEYFVTACIRHLDIIIVPLHTILLIELSDSVFLTVWDTVVIIAAQLQLMYFDLSFDILIMLASYKCLTSLIMILSWDWNQLLIQ